MIPVKVCRLSTHTILCRCGGKLSRAVLQQQRLYLHAAQRALQRIGQLGEIAFEAVRLLEAVILPEGYKIEMFALQQRRQAGCAAGKPIVGGRRVMN